MKICEKIAFYSEEEARAELERIIATDYKPWKSKSKEFFGGHKPSRVHFCKWCAEREDKDVWHLTSSIKLTEY